MKNRDLIIALRKHPDDAIIMVPGFDITEHLVFKPLASPDIKFLEYENWKKNLVKVIRLGFIDG